ncbi:hypothetical protein DXG03_005691 [Asterophora parasitica]|uniref:non-specific serine/threonine protein kinase n=1 Tax=Asterophora parasitica TaxID=117018 RepID=A0A9P7G1N8_9AGAR|nr:hypothetical protein DXG03_005691 [Asterophora parasitica]
MGPPSPSLAELSRNTSVISSSSSSSSSTSSLLADLDKSLQQKNTTTTTSSRVQHVQRRPDRTFAPPRSASPASTQNLPGYMQRELGLAAGASPPSSPLRRDAITAPTPAPVTHVGKPRFNSPQDFEFGDILGHGSYSTVIQATGKKSGRAYAIKVLDKAHLQRHNQRRTAYAEKEALVVLGLEHPGIVGLHSTFSDAWSLYFVLDLLPNGDLRALISRYGSLSIECTRYYIAQLTDAMAYMHARGVMHRDIKPENLLLDERFRLALADFGTAKVLQPIQPIGTDTPPSTHTPDQPKSGSSDPLNSNSNVDTDAHTLRRSNTFVGTPQYYSPELLAHSHTSTASDLWALGCVLFELHTGTFAFNAPSPLLTWRLIKEGKYEFPQGYDEDARDLVGRLLVGEPEKRLGALGKQGMKELRGHAFFGGVDWESVWEMKHPPLESGLRKPAEPVSGACSIFGFRGRVADDSVVVPESDAELGAQLREERLLDQDDDEISWAKDARIAAYLPGLRHAQSVSKGNNGDVTNNGSGNGDEEHDGDGDTASEGEEEGDEQDQTAHAMHSFPRVEGAESDGGLPYSFPPQDKPPAEVESARRERESEEPSRDSTLVEVVAGLALEQPVILDKAEASSKVDLPSLAKEGRDKAPKDEHPHASRSNNPPPTPLPAPAPASLSSRVFTPPAKTPTHIPIPPEFALLLHSNEHLLLASPLVPEAPAPSFVRLLPRLLSGSLRRSKPKLKERALLLTDKRVLCVNTGKTMATLKQEFVLRNGGSGSGGLALVGAEVRGERNVALLTNEKPVEYALDDSAAPTEWVRRIRAILHPPEETRT